MDIAKPMRMIDGLGKMVNDEEWKAKASVLRKIVSEDWPSMSEQEQEKTYTALCAFFAEMAEKCLAKLARL